MVEEGDAQPCLCPCRLPLALLPDGALALLLSFGSVTDVISANMVSLCDEALPVACLVSAATSCYCGSRAGTRAPCHRYTLLLTY